MKHIISISAIAFSAVALSFFMGQSEQAGLFGAIVVCSWYAANAKGEAK